MLSRGLGRASEWREAMIWVDGNWFCFISSPEAGLGLYMNFNTEIFLQLWVPHRIRNVCCNLNLWSSSCSTETLNGKQKLWMTVCCSNTFILCCVPQFLGLTALNRIWCLNCQKCRGSARVLLGCSCDVLEFQLVFGFPNSKTPQNPECGSLSNWSCCSAELTIILM